MKRINISGHFLFEYINRLQCIELTGRCSPLRLMLISPLTYAVHYKQWRIQDFPKVGAPSLLGVVVGGGRCRQHIILPKFLNKLHEIERLWIPRRGRASLAPFPLDPPLINVHDQQKFSTIFTFGK